MLGQLNYYRKSKLWCINAGDGPHEHPTQALLDALTIKKEKERFLA